MTPLNPKTAASAYLQTSGSTLQSAARRFWMNRFRMGGSRTQMPYHKEVDAGEADPLGVPKPHGVTGPGGIRWDGRAPDNLAPIRPFDKPAAAGAGSPPQAMDRMFPAGVSHEDDEFEQ